MNVHDKGSFAQWLDSRISDKRYAKDIRSRVNRASKYIDLDMSVSDAELLFKLSQNHEFNNLSKCVKSQVRRGVRLYREFASTSKRP